MISRQASHLIHIPSGILIFLSLSSFFRKSRIAMESSPQRFFEGSDEPGKLRWTAWAAAVLFDDFHAGAPHHRRVGVPGGGSRPPPPTYSQYHGARPRRASPGGPPSPWRSPTSRGCSCSTSPPPGSRAASAT